MGYPSLQACVNDLAASGRLVRIEQEIDPHLEAAEIQRQVYRAQGPAVLLANVKGCRFPMVCNLFGTMERTHYIFRDALDSVRRLVRLKIDPAQAFKHPLDSLGALRTTWQLLPKQVARGPLLEQQATVSELPQLQSWPLDGGAFVTLPQVYTEDPDQPGWRHSNLGMYRVQLSGGRYEANRQVGLHYQIHRGIGVHHTAAIRRGEPLKVNVFIGGPPALAVAAVMPLPEGLPELAFAGALGGRRIRMIPQKQGLPLLADADFCISGHVDPLLQLPEGPFGDHLGYYSLAHDFPVLIVERVYHRRGAIWPFTVVGRPPQEDTSFGQLIHELTGPIIPTVIPGVSAVHAVDAAGVHPLLLAVGSERYTPYAAGDKPPQELLTQANAILGQGQMSLAKYLLIVNRQDNPRLDPHDIAAFLRHLLERVDWRRDLHFQTCTTIDTLDYSGSGLNAGSKVVIAANGPPRRKLASELPADLRLPSGFEQPRVCLPGILAVQAPRHTGDGDDSLRRFCVALESIPHADAAEFPLLVLVDDSEFTARTLSNFLWVAFTRSNPAADLDGPGAHTDRKHWAAPGPLVLDARIKPHHAPPLEEDPAITRRVDELGAPGGPLHGII